jgi:hypothetical protein
MTEPRSLDFDQLFAAVPVDRQAALMTAPGVHWNPQRPAGWPAKSYDAPPRTRHFFGVNAALTSHRARATSRPSPATARPP